MMRIRELLLGGLVVLTAGCAEQEGSVDNVAPPGEPLAPQWSDIVLAALPYIDAEFATPVRVDPRRTIPGTTGTGVTPLRASELAHRHAFLEDQGILPGDLVWDSNCRDAYSLPPGEPGFPGPGECDLPPGSVVVFGDPARHGDGWAVQGMASDFNWHRIVHMEVGRVGGEWVVTSFTLGQKLRW